MRIAGPPRELMFVLELSFDLRWPSGALIRRFENQPDESVERFTQDMDEGYIEGIPRARTDDDGNWLEHYHVAVGNEVLQCGRRFSDYDIPHDATLTVIRTLLPPAKKTRTE